MEKNYKKTAEPMKFNKIITSIFFALIYVYSTNAFAEEYKTKSIFSGDYKCVADEQGGYMHNAHGHVLVHFKDKEEFFLTHISNIPYEAVIDLNKQMKVDSNDPNKLREELENRLMTQQVVLNSVIVEESSYFIRTPEVDPKVGYTYLTSGCTSYKSNKDNYRSMRCYEKQSSMSFLLDLETMRFTYSYEGTWNGKPENGYYGDSSVFAFGTCKKYYH